MTWPRQGQRGVGRPGASYVFRRKHKSTLRQLRVAVVGGLLVALCLGGLVRQNNSAMTAADTAGLLSFDAAVAAAATTPASRLLLQTSTPTPTPTPTAAPTPAKKKESGIHEATCDSSFETDLKGLAVIVYILGILYAFLGLAIICDEYFVGSLEVISERLRLSEDVAGATFMASASSAPELFTNVMDTFVTENNIGIGTIVGSAMFNILVIIAASGVAMPKGTIMKIDWRPLARDVAFYVTSILMILVFFWDGAVEWWEAILLVCGYVLYVVWMVFNSRIFKLCPRPEFDEADEDEKAADDDAKKTDKATGAADVKITVEADEQTPMVEKAAAGGGEAAKGGALAVPPGSEHKRRSSGGRLPKLHDLGYKPGTFTADEKRDKELKVKADDKKTMDHFKTMEKDTDAEDETATDPDATNFGGCMSFCNSALDVVSWPLVQLFVYTVPNCGSDGDDDDKAKAGDKGQQAEKEDEKKDEDETWWQRNKFIFGFTMSIVWISVFSWGLVQLCTQLGCIIGIPSIVMGITVLAAGTSIPDMLGSVVVARQGMGGMAVSNAIGSNVFDVFIGLGVPWAIKTLITDYDTTIAVDDDALITPVVILLSTVIAIVTILMISKWRLHSWVGAVFMFLYLAFVAYEVLDEVL